MSDLEQLIIDVATRDKNARKIANASRINQKLGTLADAIVVDDGVSVPAAPDPDPLKTFWYSAAHNIEIHWPPPPAGDNVASTVIWFGFNGVVSAPIDKDHLPTITGVGSNSDTAEVEQNQYVSTGYTPGAAVRIFIQHKNIWGRVGPWTDVGSGTIGGISIDTVQDAVNLSAANISGLLGYTNIETLTAAIAATKVGTGAITTGHIAANTIVAGNMAAGDAAFINAWIGTAAISSAKIADLAADKITTGNLTATVSITTGSMSAQSVTVDATGLTFNDRAKGHGAFPSSTLGDWMKAGTVTDAPNPFAGIGFFNDTTNLARGIAIRASGELSGSKEGEVVISADYGNQQPNDVATAKMRLLANTPSGQATVELSGNITIFNNNTVSLNAGGQYVGQYTDSAVAASGATASFTSAPAAVDGARIVHTQFRSGAQAWRLPCNGAVAATTLADVQTLVGDTAQSGTNTISVINRTATSNTIRITVFR